MTNQQEKMDRTNPNDPCSFVEASIRLPVTSKINCSNLPKPTPNQCWTVQSWWPERMCKLTTDSKCSSIDTSTPLWGYFDTKEKCCSGSFGVNGCSDDGTEYTCYKVRY